MQKILITGASSGIGQATAELFAQKKQNIELILCARREERLQTLKQKLENENCKIHCFTLDLRDRQAVHNFAQQNQSRLKNLDILLNNAGLAAGLDNFQDANMDDWEQMIDTNLKGLLYMTRAILPHMLENSSGHIVNIGSVAGKTVYPKGSVYCATKYAVRALNEGLRMDTVGSGVRVSSIDPGMVETEFSLVRLKGDQKAADNVYEGMTPLTAKDIAEAILWTVDRPKHVNIQEIWMMPTAQASARDISRH